jgi:2-(1,2-epoxy-1,2-dihydrophenyl)acetyl-CoA isomerase
MSECAPIRVEVEDGLAVVSLSQAARGNPIDGAFTKAFRETAAELWDTENLRAVLLRADGKNFSVGGDLKSFLPERARLGPLVRQWTSDLHMGLQRFWALPVPVVAAVQGFAMGGGAAVAAGCDIVLAGESTRLGSAFSHIGFSCDSGSSVTFTARMGPTRARRFVLLGETLTSSEAQQCGLVDKLVPDDRLQDEALALAQQLARGPTLAYGEIKRLFLRAGAANLQSMLEDEALTLARVAATDDAQEGIAAMAERRKPMFRGG